LKAFINSLLLGREVEFVGTDSHPPEADYPATSCTQRKPVTE